MRAAAPIDPAVPAMPYRWILFVVFATVGIHHVWRYATRVKADPSRSLVADVEATEMEAAPDHPVFTGTHVAILAILVATIVLLVFGIARSKVRTESNTHSLCFKQLQRKIAR